MTAEKDWLEETLRAGIEAGRTGPEGPCPSSDSLVRLVTREAGRKERRRTLDHVSGCRECALVLKSLLRLSTDFDQLAGEPPARRGSKPTLHRRAALAGLAALVGLAVVTYSVVRLSERPALRGSAREVVRLVSPKPGEIIDAADIEFRWEAVPAASRYFFELFDMSLARIWISPGLEDIRLELPPEARAHIAEGGRYFWKVTAILGETREISSKLGEFATGRRPPGAF